MIRHMGECLFGKLVYVSRRKVRTLLHKARCWFWDTRTHLSRFFSFQSSMLQAALPLMASKVLAAGQSLANLVQNLVLAQGC